MSCTSLSLYVTGDSYLVFPSIFIFGGVERCFTSCILFFMCSVRYSQDSVTVLVSSVTLSPPPILPGFSYPSLISTFISCDTYQFFSLPLVSYSVRPFSVGEWVSLLLTNDLYTRVYTPYVVLCGTYSVCQWLTNLEWKKKFLIQEERYKFIDFLEWKITPLPVRIVVY